MSLSDYLIFLTSLAVFMIIPGAGVLSCVSHSMESGFRSTLPLIFGILLGDIIYFSLSIFGLSIILEKYPLISTLFKIFGCLYLLYLGIRMLLKKNATSNEHNRQSGFWTGTVISLSNPKVMLFYLSVLPAILVTSQPDPLIYLSLYLTLVITLVSVLGLYSVLAHKAARLMQKDTKNIIHKISGGILILASLLIFIRK